MSSMPSSSSASGHALRVWATCGQKGSGHAHSCQCLWHGLLFHRQVTGREGHSLGRQAAVLRLAGKQQQVMIGHEGHRQAVLRPSRQAAGRGRAGVTRKRFD